MRDSDHSDADIRALGFDLLREEGYDEKFQGIECLAKTIKSFSADDLHTLERSLGFARLTASHHRQVCV